jgi:hypothetical protein
LQPNDPHTAYAYQGWNSAKDREASTYSKASAPEYQGALTSLSVNLSLVDVLAEWTEKLRAAELSGSRRDVSRSALAVAEAHRRLGHVEEADRAWKESYHAARSVGDLGAMAWALWSGGTLARQRGALALARRLLGLAADVGETGRGRGRTGILPRRDGGDRPDTG